MRILKVVKKGKNDVTIYFDNDTVMFLTVEVFLKSGLKKGDEISEDRFSFLVEQNKLFHIKQKAFRLLGRRQHSSSELRRKLWDKDYEQKLIDEVIKDLIRKGYINDMEFIRVFLVEKSKTKNWSRKRIKSELIKRGLSQNLIDKIFSEQPDESDYDNAIAVAKKKFDVLSKRNLEPKELQNKLSTFLFSKGFDYDTIKSIVSQLVKNSEKS